MKPTFNEHDTVVITDDLAATHYRTSAPLVLPRGQIGAVGLIYATGDGSEVEVEFSDNSGRVFAMLPAPVAKLLLVHSEPPVALAA